ncbi:tetratricopeptide repeat protein [Roseospira navarrensis]|uniref:Tetratricopeptide repeat protein n=1 Tax=Roseospira navarrensis TaxID=140058 RepID=A0A7X1ZDZ4_9PROT|nr:tetratricopeptide repeat protein [Roseospira navarrensis]MQX36289.1 tetratricopeptide repeat protein [Roseospira navarrensis]
MRDAPLARPDAAAERTAYEQRLAQATAPNERAIARLLLGSLAERCQDWPEAVTQYRHALDAAPSARDLAYFGHNNLGFSLIQMQRFDEAEPHCEAAIRLNPDRHNAFKNLGLVRQAQGRWPEAAGHFITAYEVCPSDTRAWHLLSALVSAHPEVLRPDTGIAARMVALDPPGARREGRADG